MKAQLLRGQVGGARCQVGPLTPLFFSCCYFSAVLCLLDPCLCIIGAATLIYSLYRHVQAHLQQPVSQRSSRQAVPLASAPVKVLEASQTAAINGGTGLRREQK